MKYTRHTDPSIGLAELLKSFRLPTASASIAQRLTEAGHDLALETLYEVFLDEYEDRWQRKIDRLRRASKLPPGKTLATFDLNRLPLPLSSKIRELAQGRFVDQATNVLAFGLPGTGKSHIAAALGHALIEAGRSVYYVPTFRLVQDLLAAKRDLSLPRALRKLDRFDVLILDDIGYVKQNSDEMEVLFTLLAERYERRSVMLTSNLVFSQWDRIFRDPMTTAAAIDRLVHHCVILEFDVASYRTEASRQAATTDTTESESESPDRQK